MTKTRKPTDAECRHLRIAVNTQRENQRDHADMVVTRANAAARRRMYLAGWLTDDSVWARVTPAGYLASGVVDQDHAEALIDDASFETGVSFDDPEVTIEGKRLMAAGFHGNLWVVAVNNIADRRGRTSVKPQAPGHIVSPR